MNLLTAISYWLAFDVSFPLAPLWLTAIACYVCQVTWTWTDLVGNGILLIYATAITSKTAADYFFKSNTRSSPPRRLAATISAITIVASSIFLYAIVTTDCTHPGNPPSPERVAFLSTWLALASLVFSFFATVIGR